MLFSLYLIETDLNASFTYLHEAQTKLQNAVQLKFDVAVSTKNKSQVERFEFSDECLHFENVIV